MFSSTFRQRVTSSWDLAFVIKEPANRYWRASKDHKVVYVLVIGLHQSHWLIHHGHCLARQSHWVARQSHWVVHRCYRAAYPIHLDSTPWSFDIGGYLWHQMFSLPIVTLPKLLWCYLWASCLYYDIVTYFAYDQSYFRNDQSYFGHAACLACRFWDKCKSSENYIRRRTQLCNTLCYLDILVCRPRIWSLLPIHSVRLNAAQLDLVLDCILRQSHLRLRLSHLRLSAIPSSAIPCSSRLRLSQFEFSVRLRLLYSMLVYVFRI